MCLWGARGWPPAEGKEGLALPRQATRPGRDHPSSPACPLLALAPEGSPACLRSSPQATDEDSPPNNQITYSIVNASAFGSYFDISVYEGYGGICAGRGAAQGGGAVDPSRAVHPQRLGGARGEAVSVTPEGHQKGRVCLSPRHPGQARELPHSPSVRVRDTGLGSPFCRNSSIFLWVSEHGQLRI